MGIRMGAYLVIISTCIINYCHSQTVELDNSFGQGGFVNVEDTITSEIVDIELQSDNKIVALGYSYNSGQYQIKVIRVDTNGVLDSSFGTNGIRFIEVGEKGQGYSLAIQNDDKILIAGAYFSDSINPIGYNSLLLRLDADGSIDNSFGTNGLVKIAADTSIDNLSTVILLNDGKILTGGRAGERSLLMKFNSDGSLDNTFGTGGISKALIDSISNIYSVQQLSNGKIISCGSSRPNYDSYTSFATARFNTDGTIDNSFGVNGFTVTEIDSIDNDVAKNVVIQGDGKIVQAGHVGFDSYLAIARYDSNGTIDNSFASGGIIYSTSYPAATGVSLQADGKILVSGNSLISGSNSGLSVIRINDDGSFDGDFGITGQLIIDIGTGHDLAKCIKIQPDGKVLLGGSSQNDITSIYDFSLARLTSDVLSIETVIGLQTDVIPNPNRGYFSVNTSKGFGFNNVNLYDIYGKEVPLLNHGGNSFEISNKEKGIYYLIIESDVGISSKTIVIN